MNMDSPPTQEKATHHTHSVPGPDRTSNNDVERNSSQNERSTTKQSVYAGLGWLDRLLVLWILLAMIIGILLGNFVESVGPALQRGKFVDVSVPIGKSSAQRHSEA